MKGTETEEHVYEDILTDERMLPEVTAAFELGIEMMVTVNRRH